MIIITGAAGLIGSAFAWQCNQHGLKDLILVDDCYTSEKWHNLVGLTFKEIYGKQAFLELIQHNRLPFPSSDIQAIVHLGACSTTTQTDASYLLANNYQYSQDIARWALSHGIKLIYASSAATYGNGQQGFEDSHDGLHHLRPINRYGYSKHIFDLWLSQEGLLDQVYGLKFFNVFGPNEYHKGSMMSMVCKSFFQILETESVSLFKSHNPSYRDGEQLRDFIYVKDVTAILYWMVQEQLAGGIYNIGSGTARTWYDLVQSVGLAMNKPASITYIDMPDTLRNQYQYTTLAPLNKLRGQGCRLLMRSLEDSIHDYVRGYLMQGKKTLSF